MDKAVFTAWAVYLVGYSLYPLMECLVSGRSLSRKRYSYHDRDLGPFPLTVKSMFWPVVAVVWLGTLLVEALGGAGEWAHDKLTENKHKENK
jgi:hypothetical protein